MSESISGIDLIFLGRLVDRIASYMGDRQRRPAKVWMQSFTEPCRCPAFHSENQMHADQGSATSAS